VQNIGKKIWVIAEGYLPPDDLTKSHQLVSHETACMLNAGDVDANVAIKIFYKDRDPAGPFKVIVPAHRTLHLRFDGLTDPETIPRDCDYSSLIISDQPIVVQHTRLDSRGGGLALLSTIAYPVET
jgi:hypothetical protein